MSFDWKFYIDSNEDLRKAGIDNEQKALRHYKRFGQFEDRICFKSQPLIEEQQETEIIPDIKQVLEPVLEKPLPVVEEHQPLLEEPQPVVEVESECDEESEEESEYEEETEEEV